MAESRNSAVDTARAYYNSSDADNFYFHIWGGEDIHIGLYDAPDQSIAEASQRTVARMASRLQGLDADRRVIDLGSGFGGAARYLARRFGCRVTALNLSEAENERNREMNRKQGLDDKIEVIDGSFESIPCEDAQFDCVWSQDAILHSGQRERVLAEVARVLKPGGEFVFTDPMMSDGCPTDVLQPIFDRIHLESLGSPGFYREVCARHGLKEVAFEELTENLVWHYARVFEETEQRELELQGKVSAKYIANMKKGLGHWVEGGRRGFLAWGIFHFRRMG